LTAPVLDTHAWVAWLLGSTDLSETERATLDSLPADRRPSVSAISPWEVAMLVDLKRLSLDLPLPD
jgi:PIN domain nuclease of toxin-antitoxin system